MSKEITVLGSTGSVGTQTLNVIRRCGYKVGALTANTSVRLLAEQAREFAPKMVAVADESRYSELKLLLHDQPVRVLAGADAVCEAASLESSDIICNSVVGMVGIRPTEAAVRAGKTIALSNKETIVSAGEYILSLAERNHAKILPVDSEHSAFFQCMEGRNDITKLYLTASGGPFFGKTREDLHSVTFEQTLKHPNWNMGAKVTVDSATLMNKGLELIEAVRLFNVSPDAIVVVVHRESIVHALVEVTDGSVFAYMSAPTMELPIQYALTYPKRFPGASPMSLFDIGKLTFYKPDEITFSALKVARNAVHRGGLCTAAMNGGNEAIVSLFLQKKLSFIDLMGLIDELGAYIEGEASDGPADSLEHVLEADAAARVYMLERAARLSGI